MLVFKFGGASVKDADSVRNMAKIIASFRGNKLVVVISAMGKMTNAFELLVEAYWKRDHANYTHKLTEIQSFHTDLSSALFGEKQTEINDKIAPIFTSLERKFEEQPSANFDFEYDQIVSFGEVLSTLIVSQYLTHEKLNVAWLDARLLIRTNHKYRDAEVNWEETENLICHSVLPTLEEKEIVITQGFIAHTREGFTTTLGREGSDYSAAIFAYCLNAESVTIWKDVPGMLNADPRWFSDTVKLDQISFKEAIELSYYGASVIHPKTVKPLQNKEIPLFVKSFLNTDEPGTKIHISEEFDHLHPSFIIKKELILLKITPKDFAFIGEEHLHQVFDYLMQTGLRINLMQNSALSFSFLVDNKPMHISNLIALLEKDYLVIAEKELDLLTIRHYDQATIDRLTQGKIKFLEQRTQETVRILLKA